MRRAYAIGTVVLAACLLLSAVSAVSAGATTTHKFLENWNLPFAPQLGGVDAEGNVYVYDGSTNTVHKYDSSGNPADFSALGGNVIDGAGGEDCPAVPADCDRVPRGALFGNTFGGGVLAVDPRSSGPAHGYIYVVNINFNPQPGKVEVFDRSGTFVGEMDNTITFPYRAVNGGAMQNVSVDANGHVYQSYCCISEIDQWVPVDDDPAHDKFVGQLRDPNGWYWIAAGTSFSYGLLPGEGWRKYVPTAWQKPQGTSVSVNFSPAPGPFGDGGQTPPNSGNYYPAASVDPATQNVYLPGYDGIAEWNEANQKVGPNFGLQQMGPQLGSIGFDNSGGPNNGRVFVPGAANEFKSLAIFSGPLTIPDVTYTAAEIDHESVVVHGHVDLDGGPEATACKVEYGPEVDSSGNPTYGSSLPCDQSLPIISATDLSAELPGLTTETDYHYRFVVSNENGDSPGADQVARPAAVLGVQTGGADGIDRTKATIHGSLEPDGTATTYFFEYGLDTNYDSATPSEDAGSGSGVFTVEPADLTELQSGRVYHYRLVAVNSLGTSHGPDRTFQAAAPPRVFGLSATNVAETSADLNARINPSGYDTTYYFEYGQSTSYETLVPATPGPLGDGTDALDVSAHLADLRPGVTYHFSVVATNEWGTTTSDDTTFSFFPPSCPNEHVRQETGSNYLPDCRAYELVSPGNAGAVQLFPSAITLEVGAGFGLQTDPRYAVTPQNSGLATSPARFSFYGGLGSISGLDAPNGLIDLYLSTRTTAGWVTAYPGVRGNQSTLVSRPQCSAALTACLDNIAPDAFGTDPGENAPYLFAADGTPQGRLPTNLGVIPGGNHRVGDELASADFTHYAFSSRDLAFAPDGLTSSPGSVYDNDIRTKQLDIASRLPGGGDIPRDGGSAEEFIKVPGVSTDGSHILMSTVALDGPTDLYMRVDDELTYEVSRGVGVRFVGMTADGEKVYFLANHSFSPQDTDHSADLYMWSGKDDSLTLVSQGNGQGDSDECNSSWTPQCDVATPRTDRLFNQFGDPGIDNILASDSGDIYFYSPEQLDPENPGVRNQRNLYLYRGGQVHYVTTLDPGTELNRLQVSPDGSRAAFITGSKLTGYDNAGFREMYSYDAPNGSLVCASCNPSGVPPTADVTGSQGGPFMSNDGRTFFTTRDGLVPQDTNGLLDVYEYVDGTPHLITAGTGSRDLYAGGAFFPATPTGLESVSADGTDVYFSTFDTLVGQDENGAFVKFYDARSGGGFPVASQLQPCEAADECHGSGSNPPALPPTGSQAPLGNGDNWTAPPTKKVMKKPTAHRKAKHKKAKHRKAKQKKASRRHGGRES